MVSAGESVEVTLPRNAVELNAFVVPAPTEGKAEEIGLELVTHCSPQQVSDICRMNLHKVGCETGVAQHFW